MKLTNEIIPRAPTRDKDLIYKQYGEEKINECCLLGLSG
jgi:hypothetical protein